MRQRLAPEGFARKSPINSAGYAFKYEAIYLHELTHGFKAQRVIGEWIGFYNTERPHSSLDGQTPAEAYGAGRPVDMIDKPDGLPTFPRPQQQQQDVTKRTLAA